MSYARVPRTVILVNGLTGTAAAALTSWTTAVREPAGMGLNAGACWVSVTSDIDPTGGPGGTITWTVYGSNDGGATWQNTGALVGGVPIAVTIDQTDFALDPSTGGTRYYARTTVAFYERYQVRASNALNDGATAVYNVLVTDCKGTE